MKEYEQAHAFASDIDRLVERYRQEFEITYAAVIGVLFMKAHLLCNEADDEYDDDDD